MYGGGGPNHRTQERIILVKNEPQVEVSPGILMEFQTVSLGHHMEAR